jgi:uncharacterized protein (TIGR03118 family)
MSKSARVGAIVLCSVLGGSATGCFDNNVDNDNDHNPPVVRLHRADLVSDQAGVAARTDPDLVNAWGIAYGPETGFWIADAGTAKTSIYDGDGNQLLPAIALGDEVTGAVFNPRPDEFVISAGDQSSAAVFLFATTSGKILAWSDKVLPDAPVTVYDGADEGAIYTGLAIAGDSRELRLYAANFAGNEVSVFDGAFEELEDISDKFHDPTLPADYAPFGIQGLGGLIYVTYAKQNPDDPEEELAGAGLGAVTAYDMNGHLIGHVLSGGPLNAPWAVARAPHSFGQWADALLIGNFGDGHITALSPRDGSVLGQLEMDGAPIAVEGLWGLTAGNSVLAGDREALYFTAGPDDEVHGLFGTIYATEDVSSGGTGGSTTGGGNGGY